MEIFEETSTFLDGSSRMFSKKGVETWKNLRNINIFRWKTSRTADGSWTMSLSPRVVELISNFDYPVSTTQKILETNYLIFHFTQIL